jgi:hypothetical protein
MKTSAFLGVLALVALGGVALAAYRLTASPSALVAVGIIAVDASSLMSGDEQVAAVEGGASAAADAPAPIAPVSTPKTPRVSQDMYGYSNANFHFSLLFPKDLVAKEYKEQGGALTASFQDPKTNQGFQVYVTPFGGKQIDTARFRLDEPSGVFTQPTDVIVGGAHATMFFGKNAIMGDTREVWFIRGGFLYEVTTYKELDDWLAGIMQTWKFM